MRDLTPEEMKKFEIKIRNFIGDNITELLNENIVKYHNQRVLLTSEKILKASSQVSRKELFSVGSIIGRFTKSANFRITITGAAVIERYALFRVWIKNSAEMNFLYGNNSIKSHILKLSESIPMNAGVLAFNQNDTLLGFGLLAIPSTGFDRARKGDVIILRQGDNGEFIRNEMNIS